MQFDHQGNPVNTGTNSTSKIREFGPLVFVIVLLGFAFVMFWLALMQPGDSMSLQPDASPVIIVNVPPSEPLPQEFVSALGTMAAAAVATPVTPPAAATSIPDPPCDALVGQGVCTWGSPPDPTPTPYPTCETPVPHKKCYKTEEKPIDVSQFEWPEPTATVAAQSAN